MGLVQAYVLNESPSQLIHRYNNAESRQCQNMGVPYQYDGFLFDSVQKNVYDQVRNIDLYPVSFNYDPRRKLGNFIKVGDSIIQHYQQGYLRCEVSKVTSHRNLYVKRWNEQPNYLQGKELIQKGYITDERDAKQWTQFRNYLSAWDKQNSYWDFIEKIQQIEDKTENEDAALDHLIHSWYQNPKAGQVTAPRTADREWRLQNHDLYAVPKERALYLKIQE